MTNSATLNRTLFLEDNLPVLRRLDSDSIDPIATDPPFNKGVGALEGTTKAVQNVEFNDVWNWNDDVHPGWTVSMLKGLFEQRFMEKSKVFVNSKNTPLFEFMFCVGNSSPKAIQTAQKIAGHILDASR